jgi:hypothetical protein
MSLYRELYYKLFAAVADAVEDIEQANYGNALQRLIIAQQEAEERYISAQSEE